MNIGLAKCPLAIKHGLSVLLSSADQAVKTGLALSHFVSSRDCVEVEGEVVTTGPTEMEKLSQQMRDAVSSGRAAWAGVIAEAWMCPATANEAPSAHPARSEAFVAVVADKYMVVKFVALIDRNSKTVAAPKVTILESKPIPEGELELIGEFPGAISTH